ncbi:MAG: hypothetical protein ACRDLD_00455 [Thermoleophilaceae bacterium]
MRQLTPLDAQFLAVESRIPARRGREIDPPEADRTASRRPGELEMLGRGLTGLARQPLRALRSVPTALPNLTELPGANAFPGVPTLSRALSGARRALGGPQDPGVFEVASARPPRTCFNGPISAHRSLAIGSVSLDTIADRDQIPSTWPLLRSVTREVEELLAAFGLEPTL